MVARTQICLSMNLKKQGALLIALPISAVDLAQHTVQNEQCAQKWAPIHIQGMGCQEGCAVMIEKNLRSETGVSDAVMSYESGTAKILCDPSSISMASIQKTITGTKVKDYGYRIAEVTYLNQE